MLNRQKILLYMIDRLGKEATPLEVVKFSFLLNTEGESEGGKSFYEFVPYLYGPYSFCIYQEVAALIKNGYIEESENSWKLTNLSNPSHSLSNNIKFDVDRILYKFQKLKSSELIDYIYNKHPNFTVKSKIKKLESEKEASLAIYTAGYEGKLIDGFLNTLIKNGIKRVIDVRKNPVARRYGFHKSTLNRLLGKVDIDYVHFPELGVQSDLRQDLTTQGDYDKLFKVYETTTLESEKDSIKKVSNLMLERPSVLICMEAEPSCCHRTRLAHKVADYNELKVTHLK